MIAKAQLTLIGWFLQKLIAVTVEGTHEKFECRPFSIGSIGLVGLSFALFSSGSHPLQ
jgi:hypothetical protein